MTSPRKPKIGRVKAWAVVINGTLFMDSQTQSNFWARIMRTKAQAKDYYPVETLIPVFISPIKPRRK